jgi:hypothetical protein
LISIILNQSMEFLDKLYLSWRLMVHNQFTLTLGRKIQIITLTLGNIITELTLTLKNDVFLWEN